MPLLGIVEGAAWTVAASELWTVHPVDAWGWRLGISVGALKLDDLVCEMTDQAGTGYEAWCY